MRNMLFLCSEILGVGYSMLDKIHIITILWERLPAAIIEAAGLSHNSFVFSFGISGF
jgi:hypothetical protein